MKSVIHLKTYTTVKKWYAEFKRGRTSTDDIKRPGRPNQAVTEGNIKQVHRIVFGDQKIKVSEIADMVTISTERVCYILHGHPEMKKLSARWMPRSLTIDQEQQRFDNSERTLAFFQRNQTEFLR